jgi:hypothetical protein
MRQSFVQMLVSTVVAFLSCPASAAAAPVDLGYFDPATNLQWAQLTDFASTQWFTLAAVCTPTCSATVNGHDVTGWTFASRADVQSMVTHFFAFHGLTYPGFGVLRNSNDWTGAVTSAFTPTFSDGFSASWDGMTTDLGIGDQWEGIHIGVLSPQLESVGSLEGIVHDHPYATLGAWLYIAAPIIVSQPSNRTVRAGQTVQFNAAASGVSSPTYRWQTSLDSGQTWTDLSNSGGFSGTTTDTLTVTTARLGLDQTRYRCLVANGGAVTASASARLTVIGGAAPGDYDGDRRTDLTVYRPSSGEWFIKESGGQFATSRTIQWGLRDDVPVAGDYDGDGLVDLAVYRPSVGVWYILQSSTNYTTFSLHQWGLMGDIPVPADYDGDGRLDLAVYRPSSGTWFIMQSSSSGTTYRSQQWGLPGDVPLPGDYDGDGHDDLAIYRPSTGFWYVLESSTQQTTFIARAWGAAGDIPVAGDYDGDGKTDFAVYRPATGFWYILTSDSGYSTYIAQQWGTATDVVVPGDYDADGKADFAVYRPSTGHWYVRTSLVGGPGNIDQAWGLSTDVPARARP